MLSTINNIGGSRWCRAVNKLLYSPYFIAAVSLLAVCANLFGAELPVWYIFAALVVVIVLFADDALPIVPMIGCGYISVSAGNNPAGHYGSSLFQSSSALLQLAVIAVLMAVALIARIAFDLSKRSATRLRRTPRLAIGFALLGLAYLLAGLTPARDYGPQWRSALFGLVQILCLAGPYLYFHYTVNWSKVSRLYLSQVFVGLGLAVAVEIAGMYVLAFSSLAEGQVFERGLLVTGWGIYNNVGMVVEFCIPFAFDLALRCRHSYIYAIIADVLEIALVLSQSRGSILFGTVIYLVCAIYTAVHLEGKYRWTTVGSLVGIFVVAAVLSAVFHNQTSAIFASIKQAGADDSGRWEIYREGLRQFAESAQSVLLGNGFYACGNFRYGNLPENAFLPPRYHNTLVQLLATGGLMAFAVYAFHRYQTLKLCFTRRTFEKMTIWAAILVLTLTSLVDCHFFNMGPGLLYSIVLVFAEDIVDSDTLPNWFARKTATA